MKTKSKGKMAVYDTDTVARQVLTGCLSDFRSVLPHFLDDVELSSNVSELRSQVSGFEVDGTSVYRFKAYRQVENLLKKYRFQNDVFTDAELHSNSYESFFKDQERVSSPFVITTQNYLVLQRARTIAKSILGDYSEEDMISFCKFGLNSSIGCPLRLAYIDEKLSDVRAFTGSAVVSAWFKKNVFEQDAILRRFLQSVRPSLDWADESTLRTESLFLQDVPKTFKTLRLITPLPLLDLFYSNGIGGLVTHKLNKVGLRISSLQEKHRKLVQPMSLNLRHVTADLSKASDSITCQLLNRILPRDWYCALKPILNHKLISEGRNFYTASVLPMGNGATFPIETLVFYCLIKAIGDLSGVRGIFSAYGDDLIYPSRLHKYVSHIFPSIGLLINGEKTFNFSSFRESCGADFYRGVDVRPFYLKGEHSLLTRSQYAAHLYKIYNGLRMRWHEEELPTVFRWLLTELSLCSAEIYRVPRSYPATAGLHTDSPCERPLGMCLPFSPIKKFFRGEPLCSFKYLRERAKGRFVKYAEPYYWLSISDSNMPFSVNSEVVCDDGSLRRRTQNEFMTHILKCREYTPRIKWIKVAEYRTYYRKNRLFKSRTWKRRASVCEKSHTDIIEETGSVSNWI